MKKILFILLLPLLIACKTKSNQQAVVPMAITDTNGVVFLDSIQASQAILDDAADGIFDRLSRLDMSIQLKENFPAETSYEEILKKYKAYIQTDVSDFQEGEKKWLQGEWNKAVVLCNLINKNILPKQVELIRSKGSYYGKEAFFTRKNKIVIPEYNLRLRSEQGMLSVLLHEIFHIYSRNNPDKQAELYAHIGFKNIGDSKDLLTPEVLANRILHNPDGLNYAWAIELNDGTGNVHQAIPIISSTLDAYDPSKGDFFNFLHFDLFEVKKDEGKYKVICDEKGQPQLQPETMASFFEQIGMNTQYIIHPDEILADNFMILALSQKDPSSLDRFDAYGKQLLEKIEKTIKEL